MLILVLSFVLLMLFIVAHFYCLHSNQGRLINYFLTCQLVRFCVLQISTNAYVGLSIAAMHRNSVRTHKDLTNVHAKKDST